MSSHKPYAPAPVVTLNHPEGVPAPAPRQHQPYHGSPQGTPHTGGGVSPHAGFAAHPPMGSAPFTYAQQQYAVASAGMAYGAGVLPVPLSPMAQRSNPAFGSPMHAGGAPGILPSGMLPSGPGVPMGGVRVDPDSRSERSVSSGGGSSAPANNDVLPLCPDDSGCLRVNDREHQKAYSHTCRLFPCFHAHLKYHTRYFRHAPGQAATGTSSEGNGTNGSPSASGSSTTGSVSRTRAAKHRKQARKALSSVSFTHISPDVPNAQKIIVLHATRAFEIAGDWAHVLLHTFKRYLYQVTGVRPSAQVVKLGPITLTDETASLADLGVTEGSQLVVDVDTTKVTPAVPAPLDAAPAGPAKIPVAWL